MSHVIHADAYWDVKDQSIRMGVPYCGFCTHMRGILIGFKDLGRKYPTSLQVESVYEDWMLVMLTPGGDTSKSIPL